MENKRVFEALKWASSFLKDHGRDANAGELLMMWTLGMERSTLFAEQRMEMNRNVWQQFSESVYEHARGRPIQYIIGYEEFFGRRFAVNENVLIPRPETEELIVAVLERMNGYFAEKKNLRLLDIGTGSGVIAITMKLEKSDLVVSASDISLQALEIAKKNATNLGAKVDFQNGDLLEPFIKERKKWDIILSNPPYIPTLEEKQLSTVVRDYEPSQALFGGVDGLDYYRKLAADSPLITEEKALIGLEIGVGQGEKVAELFQNSYPHAKTEIIRDINGKERIVLIFIS